jgi:imidazolonepropionase-like amidohydrolase
LAAVIAFRGATLVDGTGAAPVPDSLLVLASGRIVSAGPARREALDELPPDARIVDVSGTWIVPGLVDAHVHAESDDDLREMLRWGVTSVRLMAEDAAASRALSRRSLAPGSGLPDVIPAAPIFTAKGGWWDEGHQADSEVDRFPSTPEAARAAVRRAASLGIGEIKLMRDDMAWCRAPLPALTKLDPLIAEARRLGMRATVHAPQLEDATAAVADRATALAHGVLEPLDEATIARMKRRAVFYIPTMDVFEFLADTRGFLDSVLSDPAVVAGLSREKVTLFRSREYAEGYRRRYPNFAELRRRLPALRENLRRLHAAGVSVALGSDMWAFPGLGVSIEMDLYVKAGLTPLEAIRAGTLTAARSLSAEHDRGTLEAGKRADFLVLEADPVRDVKNVRRIRDVYKRGERVGPSALPAAADAR